MSEGFNMYILPINCTNKINFTSRNRNKIAKKQVSADSFECSGKSSGIKSKTFKMFLNTDYTPKIEPRKGYQRSFVFDRETLEPVDIYIKCVKDDLHEKEYHLFRTNPDGSLKLIGQRSMTFDAFNKKIAPGAMESFDKTLLGAGIIEHLLGVLEMEKKGYKGIKLLSLPEAYDFHKKLGFRSTDSFVTRMSDWYIVFANHWKNNLKTDENTVREMFVTGNGRFPQLNYNKTLENFVIFAKGHGITVPDSVRIEMELTPQSINEMKSLIKKTILRK